MGFDPEYVSRVLRENFEDAKTLFLSPLVAIHYAHLVMLWRRGIVSAADARVLRDALDSISLPAVMATPFDHACDDLFFHLERLLVQACGEDVPGRLPIDRQLTSDLLGFDEPTGNTYGSIATVDYLLESVSAAQVLLVGLGRVVQDLLLWCTREFGYLRLADGLVQGSSIMPQKRNPVALEHARSITSKALGQAAAIVTAVHNTPVGDIVDTEDDLQPLVASMFRDAQRAVALAAASIRGAEFDEERLRAHAEEGGTTLTELADRLVRDHDIPFSKAHALAAAYQAGDVKGAVQRYTPEGGATITSAPQFVEGRPTPGGPAPGETAPAAPPPRGGAARARARVAP